MWVNEDDTEDRMKWNQMVGEAKFHLGYTWPWDK